MDANVFEEWFNNILKKLPDNTVIVMDNASYHTRKRKKTNNFNTKSRNARVVASKTNTV